MAYRSRIVGHGSEDPEQLLANPKNFRIHPRAQEEALAGVLAEVGWVDEVLVNQTTGFVVDGHLRVAHAISQGEKSVPVTYLDLTEEEEGKVIVSFDPITAMAVTDQEKLDELLAGLSVEDQRLGDFLATLGTEKPKELGEDTADLTPPTDPITKPGDLWLLGDHRLLCGDVMDSKSLDRLLGPDRPWLLLTDPPYNVGFVYTDETNDNRSDYESWSSAWFAVASAVCARSIVTPGAVNLSLWLRLFEPRHVGIWFKGLGATTHGRVTQYWAWEPLMFHGEKWSRDRHIDVFEYPGGGTEVDHPCPKPIGLWRDLIEHFAKSNEVVLDVFGGSGTTVVAAEQTGRRCLLLEIAPAYCDVIVRRWETLTGRRATLEQSQVAIGH